MSQWTGWNGVLVWCGRAPGRGAVRRAGRSAPSRQTNTITVPDTPKDMTVRRLYQRDNLDVLRGLDSNTIDLIATDPPFNKNKDFHAMPNSLAVGASFQDKWRWDKNVHGEWMDRIKYDWSGVWHVISAFRETYGDDMGRSCAFSACDWWSAGAY